EEPDFSVELAQALDKNIENLQGMLGDAEDLVIRRFTVRGTEHKCAIAYSGGLVNAELLHNNIMKNVQLVPERKQILEEKEELFDVIYRDIISATDIEKEHTLDKISYALLGGDTVFYLDGMDQVLIMDTKGWESRAVEEPQSETVIRGPREGFVENLQVNIAQLRRYIRDPNLHFKTHQVGRRSKKDLVVAYIAGIVNPKIVKEINRRLKTIDMDDAPESGYIEQWIEESFLS